MRTEAPVFVVLALAVALLANWLRAYAIVLMGHFSGNQIGSGTDQQWWGWLIFGASMFALFAVGMRWTDERGDRRGVPVLPSGARMGSRPIKAVIATSLLLVAAWPVTAAWVASRVDARPIEVEATSPSAGWQTASRATGAAVSWTPELVLPTEVDVETFVRDGSAVSVYRGLYRGQTQGAELVNTMNQIVSSESKRWRVIESGTAQVRLNGAPTRVRTALVRGANEQFLIWQWYWFAGNTTTSDLRVKMQLALHRLTGATDTAAWVAVYTPVSDDAKAGMQTLTSFVEAMSGPIDAALETTAAR